MGRSERKTGPTSMYVAVEEGVRGTREEASEGGRVGGMSGGSVWSGGREGEGGRGREERVREE